MESRTWLASSKGRNDVTYTRDQIVKAFPPIFERVASPKPSISTKAQALVRRPARKVGRRSGEATAIDIGALRSALAHLAGIPHPQAKGGKTYSDHYATWVDFGLAIKRGLGDEGFVLFDEWSRTSSRYPGEEKSRAKWDRDFDIEGRSGDAAITVGSIFHCAKRHGWSRAEYKMRETFERGRAILSAKKEKS